MKVPFFPHLLGNVMIALKSIWSWKRDSGVLSRGCQNWWYRGLLSWKRRRGLWFLRLNIFRFIDLSWGSNNEGNKLLARDLCCGTVRLSVSWTGLSFKDCNKLWTNGFGGWFGKTTGESGEEEEERRLIISGSVGNFESSGDKGRSQSNPFSTESSLWCSSKKSGWSSGF